ncbi:transcription termination/antitermination NusG family protein [Deltaproteobacteria bacterium TL4]
MQYSEKEHWYVLRVRSKFNQLAERSLINKQFSVLNPTYQEWSQRKDRRKLLTKPIFNGYMFVQTVLNPESHLEILKTYGIIELIKTSSAPVLVPDEQIQNICLLEKHIGQCIYTPVYAVGDLVTITQGPLKGLVGRIDRVNRGLLRISVDAVPGSVAIEVSPEEVELLKKDTLYKTVSSRA